MLRSLTQAGELSADEAHQILLNVGWPPDLAAKVSALWGAGTAGKADPNVKKAETALFAAAHKAYVDDLMTEQQARDELTAAGVTAASQEQVISLWNRERGVTRSSLTPSQIKKAIAAKRMTEAEATARLADLGYTAADTATFLAE